MLGIMYARVSRKADALAGLPFTELPNWSREGVLYINSRDYVNISGNRIGKRM